MGMTLPVFDYWMGELEEFMDELNQQTKRL
jgi:hypothetical protein